MHFILYLIIGAVAGTLSGLLGIGGGLIVIPALAWVYTRSGIAPHLIMHMAAGTSITAMIFTASSSLIGHLKRKAKVWPVYKKLALGVIIGTVLGAIFGHFLPDNILRILFGLFIFFVSFRMLLATKPKPTRTLPGKFGTSLIGFIIGAKSGILGIGGGAITIPVLSYCNVPTRNIVAISVACSLTIALIGSITFALTGMHATNLPAWSTGYIYWPGFLGISITAPLCAQFGAYFSHKLPVTTLKRILGVILLLIAAQMLIH
ncbi:MAG: sulfite exporter TauE/SafE family protein [Gammaproteobacteria bacterium]|nr:sulfite exporter TauE/SafE family protein [Gammaproteobacteria bacterium]